MHPSSRKPLLLVSLSPSLLYKVEGLAAND